MPKDIRQSMEAILVESEARVLEWRVRCRSKSDAALYELARDLIADRMALVSSHIWRERRKVNRDDALCSKLQELNTHLFLERDSLSSLESVLLEACIRRNARSLDGANVAIAAIYEFHQGEGSDSLHPRTSMETYWPLSLLA